MSETKGKPNTLEPHVGESEDLSAKKSMTPKRLIQEIMKPALCLKVTALVSINRTHTKDKNVNILSALNIRY